MLQTALDHYRRQQRITGAALVQSRKTRSLAELAQIVAAFQLLAARDAVETVPRMLAEQGIADDPAGRVSPGALAGTASDGRTLEGLFAQAASATALDLMVATQVQDAARGGASVATAIRPNVTGYTRMLNPPSCSRCTILAGKFYRWNDGFLRHPKCDCRHIPTTEDRAGDLTTNPDEYFRSLSPAEQDRIFTKGGAQAIRDGADMGQVVNARRGVDVAQIFGRETTFTREGITRFGRYGQSRGAFEKERGRRYQASRHVRLMPETIYAVTKDRDDAIRLLKLNGFIF